MIPLNLANTGETQIIRKIGGNPEVKKHLEDLGFTVGGEIRVVSTLGGNLIVKVKESRVAVSEELARRTVALALMVYMVFFKEYKAKTRSARS